MLWNQTSSKLLVERGGNCIERTERTWWRNGDTERWDADEEPNSGQEARKKHQISIYYLLSTIHQNHNQERKNFTPDRKSLEVGREIRKRLNLLLMKPYLSSIFGCDSTQPYSSYRPTATTIRPSVSICLP